MLFLWVIHFLSFFFFYIIIIIIIFTQLVHHYSCKVIKKIAGWKKFPSLSYSYHRTVTWGHKVWNKISRLVPYTPWQVGQIILQSTYLINGPETTFQVVFISWWPWSYYWHSRQSGKSFLRLGSAWLMAQSQPWLWVKVTMSSVTPLLWYQVPLYPINSLIGFCTFESLQ